MTEPVNSDKNTIRVLESMINFSSVDLIITHWKEDWHQEHRACYEIGNSLARNQPMDLWYMSSHPYNLKYKEFSPDLYIDIDTQQYVIKLEAMEAYKNLSDSWTRGVINHDMWRGAYLKSQYAEVFSVGNQVIK
jgi:LmbE family N-acetylglucosaminyl deacetylase